MDRLNVVILGTCVIAPTPYAVFSVAPVGERSLYRAAIDARRMTSMPASALRSHKLSAQPLIGIDRLLGDVRTGRFERGLAALTAGGAVVTTAEIYTSHDAASF